MRPARERRLALRQRGANGGRHLHRIAVTADMHVERRRTGAQQVIVHGGDVEAAFDQLDHDRVDFGLEQHEIAHHHGLAVHRLERHPAAEREGGLDGDPVERHGQIGARKPVAVDVARYRGVPAERFVDLLPVDFLCVCTAAAPKEAARIAAACQSLKPVDSSSGLGVGAGLRDIRRR